MDEWSTPLGTSLMWPCLLGPPDLTTLPLIRSQMIFSFFFSFFQYKLRIPHLKSLGPNMLWISNYFRFEIVEPLLIFSTSLHLRAHNMTSPQWVTSEGVAVMGVDNRHTHSTVIPLNSIPRVAKNLHWWWADAVTPKVLTQVQHSPGSPGHHTTCWNLLITVWNFLHVTSHGSAKHTFRL